MNTSSPLALSMTAGVLSAAAGLVVLAAGCGSGARADSTGGAAGGGGAPSRATTPADGTTDPVSTIPKTPVYGYEVIARYPHDRGAYTQGLLWHDGHLYESTGQRGESSLRRVDLETGKVLKQRNVETRYFAEGLALVGGVFYQLTWTLHKAFLYDAKTLAPLSYDYSYPGEGWGLTSNSEGLVMSDGTDIIRFLDPKGLTEIRRIEVRDQGRRVFELNELEWIDDEIWANVWKRDRIARIDPKTGVVKSWVDLAGILGDVDVANPAEEVLNGIAYDKKGERLFVTGKRWPFLYHVRVVEK